MAGVLALTAISGAIAMSCSSFGPDSGGAPDGSISEEAGRPDAEASTIDAPDAGPACTNPDPFSDDFEREDIATSGLWTVNVGSRSSISITPPSAAGGGRVLKIEVDSGPDGSTSTTGGYLRRSLDGSCAKLRFRLRVTPRPTGDLFAALVSAPRMDGGGGSGPGANVDVLILIGKDRKLRFREQVSGGIASTELVSTSIDDDTFHDVELDVSAGKTFGVAIKVDGRGVPIPAGSEPRFLLDGPLRTLILGPSYADQATAATLFYDDFELR